MKKICLGISVLALAAGIMWLCFTWKDARDIQERNKRYEQMRQKTAEEDIEFAKTQDQWIIPVDFETLRKMNTDIYAWITIPGTTVDYPVLQNAEDNARYLVTDASGAESDAGAIFSEHENARDFSDVHTVLYGRNMDDGSMFGALHQFEDDTFFEAHRVVKIYTPDAVHSYRIFAAYRYDDRHLLQSFDCSDPNVFQSYIRSIVDQRNLYACIDKTADIQWGDRILTLSTGDASGDTYRYLVQAVLIDGQKRD